MYRLVLLTFGGLFLMGRNAYAQQDPQFSQYMFNPSYWSVALTGVDGKSSITAFSRNQWLGYETTIESKGGAPITHFLNFTAPLSLFKNPISLGTNLIYDKMGPMTNIEVQLGMAYHWEFPRGTLSAGLRPSINNQTIDFATLDFLNPDDEIYSGKESQWKMDLDAGVSFNTAEYSIGLGVSHLLRPTYDYGLSDSSGESLPLSILYSLYGEYKYALTYKFTLAPSLLFRTDINTYTFSAGITGTFNDRIWTGVAYKNADSMVVLFGYSFLSGNALKVGYSLDYVLNDKESKSQTSHEIYIRYNLPSINAGSKKIIRTPRFRY